MKKDARERFTLRLPTTLFSKLQVNGEELGVSTNALILQILWDWMEHKENEDLKIEKETLLNSITNLSDILDKKRRKYGLNESC